MKKYLFLAFLLLFSACAERQSKLPIQTKSVNLLISSPKTKLNETGFLHKNGNNYKFQLYSSGNSLASITFGKNICFKDLGCKDELKFQEEFLGKTYVRKLFSSILEGQPLYNGKNLVKNGKCFSQNVNGNSYEVCKGEAKFIDKEAKIKIIVKNLDGE